MARRRSGRLEMCVEGMRELAITTPAPAKSGTLSCEFPFVISLSIRGRYILRYKIEFMYKLLFASLPVTHLLIFQFNRYLHDNQLQSCHAKVHLTALWNSKMHKERGTSFSLSNCTMSDPQHQWGSSLLVNMHMVTLG